MMFGSDIILNTTLIFDWESIGRCKQELIDINNQNEHKIANQKTIDYVIK